VIVPIILSGEREEIEMECSRLASHVKRRVWLRRTHLNLVQEIRLIEENDSHRNCLRRATKAIHDGGEGKKRFIMSLWSRGDLVASVKEVEGERETSQKRFTCSMRQRKKSKSKRLKRQPTNLLGLIDSFFLLPRL
jgi:hypothetical protein